MTITDTPNASQAFAPIPLHWLDTKPSRPKGVTFGIPLPRGVLREAIAHLQHGKVDLPTQTWPLATWPDGSIKFLGVAAVIDPANTGEISLVPGAGPNAPQVVLCHRPGVEIFLRVTTGVISVDVGDRGVYLIQEAKRANRTVVGGVRLITRRQHRNTEDRWQITKTEDCLGEIESATIEQSGPIRAVIRLDGRHRGRETGDRWLPFRVRLEFFAGSDTIHVTHTMTYDGRAERDFIAGLGVTADVPLTSDPHNRHARVVGVDGDVWSEPVRWTGDVFKRYDVEDPHDSLVVAQTLAHPVQDNTDRMRPCFADFQLLQHGSDQFRLRKRTGPNACWVEVGTGTRAPGLMALSEEAGGLAIALREFWEAWPRALEITKADGPLATVTAWLWSHEAEPMDMRHYGERDYRPTYEAVNPDPDVYSSATGVARTSHLELWLMPAGVEHADLPPLSTATRKPPLLVATPQHYHSCKVFGPWAPIHRSDPAAARIEDELERHTAFYIREMEQRRWYGFWNAGDGMLGFDPDRQAWRYDIGGFAWWNSELAGDLYWWMLFLRSGRADYFHIAANMTRHVAEVDTFHLGPWKGIGSRHNVVHWGCPCKEPRVSQALPKRVLYYLTADPRIGDLLDEVADADATPATNDVMETVRRVRVGSNWLAYAANWMTAWERTGDPKWRAKIEHGLDGILSSTYGLMQTDPFLYNVADGSMTPKEDMPFGSWLTWAFGGDQTLIELAALLDRDDLRSAMTAAARLTVLTGAERARLAPAIQKRFDVSPIPGKLAAWAVAEGHATAELAVKAWHLLQTGEDRDKGFILWPLPAQISSYLDPLSGRTVQGWDQYLSYIAQWGHCSITFLALIPQHIPKDILLPKRTD
ncbi:hypothetical protein LBMAG53_35050 [Planctomycetota bacterium]|nr:hypothetical protein LBMAG53_35050 [Planctomycetota bacterium]